MVLHFERPPHVGRLPQRPCALCPKERTWDSGRLGGEYEIGAYDCVIAPQTAGANVDPLIKPRYARELLVPVYSWFTDGFDTLGIGKALLDELHA
jgi:hypothetical protein